METYVKERAALDGSRREPARRAIVEAKHTEQERGEIRMRRGKALVISGFVVALIGVVLYCAVSFAAGVNQELGQFLFNNFWPFSYAGLAVIGVGTMLWVIGSFLYLAGAMDSDSEPGAMF